jgi:PadR family transcriptional regulator, regulatory protein PadR
LGPLHGYGILLRIGQISGNALVIEQGGALYPGLFRLVRQGLLNANWGTSDNNRRAKFYELTATGRKRLREETDTWNRLATAIASALSQQPEEVGNCPRRVAGFANCHLRSPGHFSHGCGGWAGARAAR